MEEKKAIWCGIDVSKNDMVAALDIDREQPVRKLPSRKFARTIDGLRDVLEWCAAHGADEAGLRVLMESTGNCSRELLQWFQNHFPHIPVSMGNPTHIKHFIDSEHLGNKTDSLDAKAIARMGTTQKPRATPLPPPEYLQLQNLVRARDTLKTKMRSLEVSGKAMLDVCSLPFQCFMNVVKVMEAELEKIEYAILDLIARMPELKAVVEIMCTMPGVSIISAATILSEMGPFSNEYSRDSFSAYTGLRPVQSLSGTSVNKSRLSKCGSPLLRKVIYMCSLHSVSKIPSLKSFHERLVAKGKKPLTARSACMRKMLLILRSMVLNQRDFQENYVSFEKKGKVI